MVRLLIALALLWPLAAGAGSNKKKRAHPDVEIWPPPAPGTDQAGSVLPPPPKAPEPPPDAGDPYTLDPAVLNDQPPAPEPKPSDDDDAEDACADGFSTCSEDCIVAHATDDTLHVKPGAKLPIQICESRCRKRRSICREQKRVGIDQNDPHRRDDEDLGD